MHAFPLSLFFPIDKPSGVSESVTRLEESLNGKTQLSEGLFLYFR